MLTARLISAARPLMVRHCSASSVRAEVYRELEQPSTDVTDLVDRYCYVPSMQQQVLVIQPFIRFGGKVKADTSHELMLAESVALVETLDWVVGVDHLTVGLSFFLKKHLFGTGKLELRISSPTPRSPRSSSPSLSVPVIER